MYHSFITHLSADGHIGCFHVLGYYKQCCDEHWGARVCFRSGFLSVYAQEWDCWVIWQFYFLFFMLASVLTILSLLLGKVSLKSVFYHVFLYKTLPARFCHNQIS